MNIANYFRSAEGQTKPADLVAFDRARERCSNGVACVTEQADILGNLVRGMRGREAKRISRKSGKPR